METCGRCCAAAPELTLQLSPFRPPPPRRPGLSLATEPALPFRGVDARPRVRLASRHVVDTHSFPADVPLDAALAGIAPHYSFKPVPAAPAPRRHEVPSPHPATGGLRCGLLRNVIARILPVRERPPLRDHPRIHVLTSEAAHGDDSPVAVTVALLAGDRRRPAMRSRSARVAAAPQGHVLPATRQVCFDSGASIPWSRIRWAPIRRVSPSVTQAEPTSPDFSNPSWRCVKWS